MCLLSSRVLDLSFNRISKIENLDGQSLVKKLFLTNNKITKVENLGHMTCVQMLELGANRIRVGLVFQNIIIAIINTVLHNPAFLWKKKKKNFRKHYGKRRKCCLPAFSPLPTMFSTHSKTNFNVHLFFLFFFCHLQGLSISTNLKFCGMVQS